MKKYAMYVLTPVLMLSSTMVSAQTVSKETARERAAAFVSERGGKLQASTSLKMIARAPLKNSPAKPGYYVFNVADKGGFVIVSGDERTPAILGYSDSGSFDEATLPVSMKDLLGTYTKEIELLADQPADAKTVRRASLKAITEYVKPAISPLVKTLWDQGYPYNGQCPSNTLVGCVGTSMSQVVNYHQYPAATVAEIPAYTTNTGRISIAALPQGTAFDWTSISAGNGSAIATLCSACSRSVKMDFQSMGSVAFSESIPYALKTFFGYDDGVKLVTRSDYGIEEWQNMMYNELANGCPVIYSGMGYYSLATAQGHSFVIDGYDGDGYFHVNWGWSGVANGYFLLSILHPGYVGTGGVKSPFGYSNSQAAVIGIKRPDSVTAEDDTRLTCTEFTLAGNKVSAKFQNKTGVTDTYEYGIGFYTTAQLENNRQPNSKATESAFSFMANSSAVSYTYTAQNNSMHYGAEYCLPISKKDGSSKWYPCLPKNKAIKVSVTSEGGRYTMTLSQNNPSLTVTDFDQPAITSVGVTTGITATVQNNGGEFDDFIYVFGSTDNNKGPAMERNTICVKAGGTIQTKFYFIPKAAGTFHVWLATDAACTNIIGTTDIEVAAVNGNLNLIVKDFGLIEPSVCGRVKGVLKIQNNEAYDYAGGIQLRFEDVDGHSTELDLNPILTAGEETEVPYEVMSLPGLDTRYRMTLKVRYYKGNENVDFGQLYFYIKDGYRMFDANGNQTAAEFTGSAIDIPAGTAAVLLNELDGPFVFNTPSTNPNCLYYFKSGASVTGLSGKNVVYGGTAPNITLTDGEDFYIPQSFTATNISYSRTHTKYVTSSRSQWETLMLPFKVSSVWQGTKQLDWFHSSTDVNKNMWIKEFVGTDGSNVYFDYAGTELKANKPYIVTVPGEEWGSEWDLKDKVITYEGENAAIIAGAKAQDVTSVFKFVGFPVHQTISDGYFLTNGLSFIHRNTMTGTMVRPFNAYFANNSGAAYAPQLTIVSVDDEDGDAINGIEPTAILAGKAGNAAVRDLQGRRVVHPAKGVYIVGNKKVLMK